VYGTAEAVPFPFWKADSWRRTRYPGTRRESPLGM